MKCVFHRGACSYRTLEKMCIRDSPDAIRKVAIAMYEGEINMVIHAKGGVDVYKRQVRLRSVPGQ